MIEFEKNNHTNSYTRGEKGTEFSLESLRSHALKRVHRDGWTTTIHHHTSNEECDGHDHEHYFPEPDEDEAE